jgi:5-methyltetrahydrofolate--homocysteine methyltransferase
MARGLVRLAQQARKKMTPAEAALWVLLRDRRLGGRKFRRQAVIGRYRPDFYCFEERLVVELDGSIHDLQEIQAYDLERTKWLEAQGLKVIRFQNHQVLEYPTEVLKTIQSHFTKTQSTPKSPSPAKVGEGVSEADG